MTTPYHSNGSRTGVFAAFSRTASSAARLGRLRGGTHSERRGFGLRIKGVNRLVEAMDAEIIRPDEARFDELVMRRAETLRVRRM
jgi:hypothetical protein